MRIGIFNVRLVKKGERYGVFDCFVHDDDRPLVEFFDSTKPLHGALGQFVSRYYCETFLSASTRHGLLLDTGSSNWFLSPEQVTLAKEFVVQTQEKND